MTLGMIGDRAAVEAYLASPQGARFARAMAREIFADEERLCRFELGEDSHPAPVEYALDRLIAARNAGDE